MQITTSKIELAASDSMDSTLSLFSVDVYTSHRLKHQFYGHYVSSAEAFHGLFIHALFAQIGTIEVLALYQGDCVPNRKKTEPLSVYRRPQLPSVPHL